MNRIGQHVVFWWVCAMVAAGCVSCVRVTDGDAKVAISQPKSGADRDYESIMAVVKSDAALWAQYEVRSVQYVEQRPGGFTTNIACVTLVERQDQTRQRGVVVVYGRANDTWMKDKVIRVFNLVSLYGSVTYEQADAIQTTFRRLPEYTNDCAMCAILASDGPFFAWPKPPPSGTQFVVQFQVKKAIDHNRSDVYVSFESNTVRVLGKRDRIVIH